MFQINLSLTPEGYSRLELDCSHSEITQAEKFFDYLAEHIKALETAAKNWGKEAGHER